MNTVRRSMRLRREKGAVAIVVAMSMLVLMAAAALGVDIGALVYTRQTLRNSLDAAAQAGSYSLPDTTSARSVALTYFKANFKAYTKDPTISFYCVVASTGTAKTPNTSQVTINCPAAAVNVASANCNQVICAVPCPEATTSRCNTIKVTDSETVSYTFGPAIGIPTGNTGAITSAACRGSCGTASPNPLNVVVMADRTPSMSDDYIVNTLKLPSLKGAYTTMQQSLKDMLLTMNRDQQYVAFGTIAKSAPYNGCATAEPSSSTYSGLAFSNADFNTTNSNSWSSTNKKWTFNGSWVPVGFTRDYTTGTAEDGNLALNTSSALYKAINCMDISDSTVKYPIASGGNIDGVTYKAGQSYASNEGTHLAAALKGAAQYLLDTSHLNGMPDRSAYGTPKNVIVFETDGSPSEIFNSDSSSVTLDATNTYDIGVAGNDNKASCDNFLSIANLAKAKGIQLITIGVGAVSTSACGKNSDGSTNYVRNVLSSAANGSGTTALDCTKSGNAAIENADGNNYYCAATAADLASVFTAAMGSVSGNTRLISIDGFSS